MIASNDDRIRQAEQDAARAREIAEEEVERRITRGSDSLPSLDDLKPGVTAKLVREYIRAAVIEPVVRRLYDIGMGVQKFDVPTMAGNVVSVPAPSSVQVKALLGLVQMGVPASIGLTDASGEELPGVFALGPMELDEARRVAHGTRYISPPSYDGNGSNGGDPTADTAVSLADALTPGLGPEFEIVEVEDTADMASPADDQAPPVIESAPATLEQQILARRRSRRNGANGNGNGSNGK